MPNRWNFNFGGTPQEDFTMPRFDFSGGNRFNFNSKRLPAQYPQRFNGMSEEPELSNNAYDNFMRVRDEMPIYGDKQYELGKWGKLGSILAGAAIGGLTNNPGAGMEFSQGLFDKKYNTAMSEWTKRFKGAKEVAEEERLRNKELREGRESNARTRKLGLESDKLDIELPFTEQEANLNLKTKLANLNKTDAEIKKIEDDLANPELKWETTNTGDLIGFDRQGNRKVVHRGINLSQRELEGIRHKNRLGEIDAQGEQSRLNIDREMAGFGALEEKRQLGRIDLENKRHDNRLKLQNDKQENESTKKAQRTQQLSNPQFKREFTEVIGMALNDPELANTEILDKIRRHYAMGRDGFAAPTGDDIEGLTLYNQLLAYGRSKGKFK